LVAYYPLNGDAKDYSGYGNDGTLVNVSPVPDRFGIPGGAVSFNGTDGYAEIPQSPQLTSLESTNEITISTWISLPDLNSDVACVYICKYNTADDGGWEIGVNSDGIGFGTDNLPWPSGQGYGCNLGTVQAEQWMHVVVTGSRSRQRVCFYLNGRLPASQDASNFLLGSTVGPLYLGQSPLGPDEFRASQMDDFRIYSRALSDVEIRGLYEQEAGLTNAPPVISTQPTGGGVGVGEAINLGVCAKGTWPFAYQWRQDGVDLLGATNDLLALARVSPAATGDYTVVVTNAFGSVTSAVARVTVFIRPSRLFVSLDSPNPTSPYTNWAAAAHVIQDAVDAAAVGATILVTNGVYAVGRREVSVLDTNQEPPQSVNLGPSRVVVTNAIRLESVNGPVVTTVEGTQPDEYGEGAMRCVYLGNNAVLSGFTLTNGYADRGGGVRGGTVYNCVLTGNKTVGWKGCSGGGAVDCTLYNCALTGNLAWGGGGAAASTLYNCTLTGNSALLGGGAWESTFYNCTLTGNSAETGGGADSGKLYSCTLIGNRADLMGGGVYGGTLCNCIVYYNTAPNGADYFTGINLWDFEVSTLLHYSCTTPPPTNGVGNITGPPLFMDMAAGDFRLREDSPCIDAGTNLVGFTMTITNADSGDISVISYAHDPTDILGNTRFIDGNGDGVVAWDLGAYEFNSFRPPRFAVQPQLTADGWKLNITGAANQWVHLQRSSNLKDWEDIWSGFMGAEEIQQVNDGDTGQKATFYRVVVP
jgi:hypothetical protein